MNVYYEEGDYYCALAGPHDFKIFSRAENLRHADKSSREAPLYLKEVWRRVYAQEHVRHFILLQRLGPEKNFDGDKILGLTQVQHDPHCPYKLTFTGSALLDEGRKRHLGDILYKARFVYALADAEATHIEMRINSANKDALKAALRHGFECDTGNNDLADIEKQQRVMVFTRRLTNVLAITPTQNKVAEAPSP